MQYFSLYDGIGVCSGGGGRANLCTYYSQSTQLASCVLVFAVLRCEVLNGWSGVVRGEVCAMRQ